MGEPNEDMVWDVLDAAAGDPWGFRQWNADDRWRLAARRCDSRRRSRAGIGPHATPLSWCRVSPSEGSGRAQVDDQGRPDGCPRVARVSEPVAVRIGSPRSDGDRGWLWRFARPGRQSPDHHGCDECADTHQGVEAVG